MAGPVSPTGACPVAGLLKAAFDAGVAENFVDGPLLEAMRSGGFLYIEEFSRAPEDTLNTLLTAMPNGRSRCPGPARSWPSPRSGSSPR